MCPALGHQICAVCCGTKRLSEIRCPADCGYLTSARVHPPAVVQRQQERDLSALVPLLEGLDDSQVTLFFALHGAIAHHHPDPLSPLRDEDVAQAADAVASTLETQARGVIYEHRAASAPGQRLQAVLSRSIEEFPTDARQPLRRNAIIVLRRMEQGARAARQIARGDEMAYVQLVKRVLDRIAGESPQESDDRPRLILP
jgi:hypothetical protein